MVSATLDENAAPDAAVLPIQPNSPDEIQGIKQIAPGIRHLSQVSSVRGLLAVMFDWTVIVACFTAALQFPSVWVWIAAAVVIASRQHALLILMHDASHYRLVANRAWNDRISNWLLSWPVFVSTEGYRQNHLAHHMHLNTDDDPDWTRKEGKPEWTFPKTKRAVAALLIRELFGGGFIEALKSIVDLSGKKDKAAQKRSAAWEKIAYYAVVAVAITAAGIWPAVLLLWFLPAFTLLTVILRVRSIAEHFGVEGRHELNMTRNVFPNIWERMLMTPHYSGYHLDHHLFPSVPFYNLPELHKLLKTLPDYQQRAHQSRSLFGPSQTSVVNEISAPQTSS